MRRAQRRTDIAQWFGLREDTRSLQCWKAYALHMCVAGAGAGVHYNVFAIRNGAYDADNLDEEVP